MWDEMSGMENSGPENAGTLRNAASLVSMIQRADAKGNNIARVKHRRVTQEDLLRCHVQDGSRHLLSAAHTVFAPCGAAAFPVMYRTPSKGPLWLRKYIQSF